LTYEIKDEVLHLTIPLESLPNEPARGMVIRLRRGEAKCFRDLLKETDNKKLPIMWMLEPQVEDGQNKRSTAEGLPPKAGRKNSRAG
jgi:hypothetical protein